MKGMAVIDAEKENWDMVVDEDDDPSWYEYGGGESRGSAGMTQQSFGDRVQSRGMRKTADRNEFKISKKKKKRSSKWEPEMKY